MSTVTLDTSIPALEREMFYCQSKADFISDFLDPANEGFRVTVTLGLSPVHYTEFMISDLFSADMEKTLLAQLRDLFLQKANAIEQQIKDIKRERITVTTGGR